jgi:bifunctional non-homologous end joining protein LigD
VSTAEVRSKSTAVRHVLVQDLPTLLWAANLAALEIHVPQWRAVPPGQEEVADRIVFDLDPGPPATVVECCEAALLVRDALRADGLDAWPKTSGSKGLHLYVPLTGATPAATSAYAKALAVRLERQRPDLVLHRMARGLRAGKVFVDWSQNARAKTTVAPYVLRARAEPTVSTPLGWDEIDSIHPDQLTMASLAARLDTVGDPWLGMNDDPQSLEPLLEMSERDLAGGLMDAPWPPVYPKQPGEPPRVAPSRARKT